MANQNIPNDPYVASNEAYRSSPIDDPRSAARLDNDLQMDPELAEGPASGSRVAVFTVAIALVLGAVFYGLNNTSLDQAGTAKTADNTTAQTRNGGVPPAPPGMRDVTPRADNTQSGVTTGAATNRPTAPAQKPTGTEVDRSANQNSATR